MSDNWDLAVGTTRTRTELAAQYGGSPYSGGVVPSNSTPNIFLFTDPSEGSKYGYNYDGLDVDGSTYFYTGKGTTGDQRLDDANGSVLAHRASGRAIRLFKADGVVPGTQTKSQRYVGEYTVDPDDPFRPEPAIGRTGSRTVVVFKLLPVGDVDTAFLGKDQADVLLPSTEPVASLVPLEVDSTQFFEMSGSEARIAERAESSLIARFRADIGRNIDFKRWTIRVPGEKTILLTDLYDSASHTLYEAKASARRASVRMAVGQILDYRRHIDVIDLRCRLLLSARPTDDLIALCTLNGIDVVYEAADGIFEIA